MECDPKTLRMVAKSCTTEKMAKTLYKIFEGRLEVKLPTIWTDGKVDVGRVREEKRRREGQRKKK